MDKRKTSRKIQLGISRSTLWGIGIFLVFLGMISRGLIQNRFLQVNVGTTEDVLRMLEASGGMTMAAAALILEALEACSVPIFAILTVEGFEKTENFRNYVLRVLGIALLSEVPYNFALTGKLLDPTGRNPVFGILICLVMLYLYRQYTGMELSKILIKTGVLAAAVFWAVLLGVKYGCVMILLTTLLWGFRNRESLRYWIAAVAAVCCCVTNPLYMFMPFGFLTTYLYTGKQGILMHRIQYLFYPVMLVLIGLVGVILR